MNQATPSAPSVFITGASSGLGRQMAIEFARRGYRLALTARRLDLLETLRALGYTPEGGFPDAPEGSVPPAVRVGVMTTPDPSHGTN